jgi:chromosome partitioning protein
LGGLFYARLLGYPQVFDALPEVDKAKEFLRPHSFPIAPVNIGNRRAFSRAIITGSAVTEFEPKGKAAQEITELWQWIAKQIGKHHGKK